MQIAISMIALNEEAYIYDAIKSCSFANDVVVVDGGSEDKTTNLIHVAAGEIGIEDNTHEVKWDNHFGVQRTESLALVPEHCDWWMRLDSDEVYSQSYIENIRRLLEGLPEDCLCARIRQINLVGDVSLYSAARGGWETWPRIFRNIRLPDGRSAWRWIGQVHEVPRLMTKKGLIDPEPVSLNLPVVHYGWLNAERRQDREDLYVGMEGSGFKAGSLTERNHVIRRVPKNELEMQVART